MDINMKINSNKLRDLRNQRGWSQEQLSGASGLSLRTIQRIEAEGNTSRESKVCLAATFGVDLSELDFVGPSTEANNIEQTYKPNKVILSVGLLSMLLSIIGYLLFTEPSYIFLIANMLSLSAIMHTFFDWYFSEGKIINSSLRRSARVFLLYVFCYSAFSLIGGHNIETLVNGILSGCILVFIYYFVDLKLNANKSASSIVNQA